MSSSLSLGRLIDAAHAAVELLDTIHDEPAVQLASAELAIAAAAVSAEALALPAPMSNTQAERVEALAALVLVAFAEGRVQHLNRGLCPDEVEGPDTRDPDCPVCLAITSIAARNTTQQQGG